MVNKACLGELSKTADHVSLATQYAAQWAFACLAAFCQSFLNNGGAHPLPPHNIAYSYPRRSDDYCLSQFSELWFLFKLPQHENKKRWTTDIVTIFHSEKQWRHLAAVNDKQAPQDRTWFPCQGQIKNDMSWCP